GTLALVASSRASTISVFSIAGKILTPVGDIPLEPKSQATDVAISPDGRMALVTERGSLNIVRLAIDGTKVTPTGIEITTGIQPYGVVVSRDGRFAYSTNLFGPPPPAGAAPGRYNDEDVP